MDTLEENFETLERYELLEDELLILDYAPFGKPWNLLNYFILWYFLI